jgi:1-acyl-sn-glycerol-3-phosphate acyltransferase
MKFKEISEKVIHRLGVWASYLSIVGIGLLGFALFRFPFNFTRVRGKKNIPKQGKNVLFVANHITMYDSLLIAVAAFFPSVFTHPSRPPLNFAAEENFFTRWYLKLIFRFLRTIPVKRGRKDPFLLRKYAAFLERHNILVFYQGGRSYDLKRIKSGPAYVIATAEREPIVVPVYHEGIDRIFRRGGPRTRSWLRWLPLSIFRRAKVRFGRPISFGDLRRIEDLKERVAAINQRIVEQIERLKSPPSDSAFA